MASLSSFWLVLLFLGQDCMPTPALGSLLLASLSCSPSHTGTKAWAVPIHCPSTRWAQKDRWRAVAFLLHLGLPSCVLGTREDKF